VNRSFVRHPDAFPGIPLDFVPHFHWANNRDLPGGLKMELVAKSLANN
jgi:hypothetical protein